MPKKVRATLPPLKQFFQHLKETKQIVVDVAEKSGVAASTISDWRRGFSAPRLDLFIAVCNTAGLEIELRKRT